jgi:hypothetical protein
MFLIMPTAYIVLTAYKSRTFDISGVKSYSRARLIEPRVSSHQILGPGYKDSLRAHMNVLHQGISKIADIQARSAVLLSLFIR